MRYVFLFLGILFFFILGHSAIADNTIRINEFLIDPTPQQVEIINTGAQSVDISGWFIDDNGGSTYYTIPQSTVLYPNACLVFSGDFNLNKSRADTVILFNSANLIDSFSYKSSSGSGISYLRLPDGIDNWTTKSASLGMYNETGASCIITPTLTPTLTPSPIQNPTPSLPTPQPTVEGRDPVSPTPSGGIGTTITPISYQNIYISEAMINPPSGENEWIEFFNNNDFIVTLTYWLIDDIENAGSSPKLFSLEIPAKNHGVVDLSSSMFNNTGDSVRLLDFNKNRIDDFEYASTTQGKTLGRVSYDLDEFCLQEPSKGIVNNSCINLTATPNPTSKRTDKPTNPPYLSVTAVMNRLINQTHLVSINQLIDTNSVENDQGEILGISDENQSNQNKKLIRSLSFVSLFYSLLAIVSIILKMKFALKKL